MDYIIPREQQTEEESPQDMIEAMAEAIFQEAQGKTKDIRKLVL